MENPTNVYCNRQLDKMEESDSTRIGNATTTEIQKTVDMQKDKECPSTSKLIGLIKQSKNGDFKSIVSSMNQSDLINIGGRTLMHTAAERSNIEILEFLITSGFDINAQNTLGQTPLHLALRNNNFQVAELLLSLDADILATDSLGVSTLQMCFLEEIQVPEYISICFLERLSRSGMTAHQVADNLENVGCSIHQALAMNDAEVTSLMLDRKSYINEVESDTLLERAMSLDHSENLKALLKYGPGLRERRYILFGKVTQNLHKPKMKLYFKQLNEWDVINEEFVYIAAYAFECENEDVVQMYLDIGIDDYARTKFGLELLVGLLRNDKVDCFKIFDSRQFDVNGRDMYGYNALHEANKNPGAIIYLLENGADPNIKNSWGQTPLFGCYDDESIEMLLEAGADVQVLDSEGYSIVEKNFSERIAANLCILEARGLLKRELVEDIETFSRVYQDRLRVFNSHRQDLKWMKTRCMWKPITLFTVLVDLVENTVRHVKSKDEVDMILLACDEHELGPIYKSMLIKNLKKILKLHELQPKAADFLCNTMKINQRDHLVIEKIISFFTYRDFLVFDKLNIE